ncbi:MAG: hypothetical protein PHD43_08150 [Methylococcales bacterium]|nr:hypothetical protein [Methylococcales bacterium]
MYIPFKSSPIEFNQKLLFPSDIFDLLAEDHEFYLYTDLFRQLDTSVINKDESVALQQHFLNLGEPWPLGTATSNLVDDDHFAVYLTQSFDLKIKVLIHINHTCSTYTLIYKDITL